MNELETIEDQIAELTNRRKELQDKEKDKNLEFLRSMEWAKGARCRFEINPYAAYGNSEYGLRFWFTKEQEKNLRNHGAFGHISLKGDKENLVCYQQNLILYHDEWGFIIKTSDVDLLVETIQEIQPIIDQSDWFDNHFKAMKSVAGRMIS